MGPKEASLTIVLKKTEEYDGGILIKSLEPCNIFDNLKTKESPSELKIVFENA